MQINLMNNYYIDNLYSDEVFSALADKNDFRVQIISSFYFIFIFASIFLIGRWFFVSAKINHLAGKKELKVSPGWAVGWYFIPIANLVMPYRSLKETFKASFSTEKWLDIKVPQDFPVWWATFLIGNGLSNRSLRMQLELEETYTFEKLNQISYVDMASDFVLIINALALLNILNTIYKNHQDKIFKLHPED
jgi:hypothetical protein